jgi:hypothetical protein
VCAKVYAFEPDPFMFSLLRRSAAIASEYAAPVKVVPGRDLREPVAADLQYRRPEHAPRMRWQD